MSSTINSNTYEEVKHIFGDTKYNEFLAKLFINNPLSNKQEIFETKYYTCFVNGENILEKYKNRYNPFIIQAIIEAGKFHKNINKGSSIDSSKEQTYIWDNLYKNIDNINEITQYNLLKYFAIIPVTPASGGARITNHPRNKLETNEISILPSFDLNKIDIKLHKIVFLEKNFIEDIFTKNNLPIIGDIYNRANNIKLDLIDDTEINFSNFKKCNIDELVLNLVKNEYGIDMENFHKKLVNYNIKYHKEKYDDKIINEHKILFDEKAIIEQLDMTNLNENNTLNNFYILRNHKLVYPQTDKDLELIFKDINEFFYYTPLPLSFSKLPLSQLIISIFKVYDNTIVNKYIDKENIDKILDITKYKLKGDAKNKYRIGDLFKQIQDREIAGPNATITTITTIGTIGSVDEYTKIRDENIFEPT